MSAVGPLLAVQDLVVSFGGVLAVDRVSFDVMGGSLHGLIGPNGAGKTTTLDAVSGFVPHEGRIVFGGDAFAGLPAHERARRGLVRTFQSLELFDDLTVRENCRVGAAPTGVGVVAREALGRVAEPGSDVDDAIGLLGLSDVVDRFPNELALGRRKLVAVARALAAGPRLVLLDEPAAGLDSDESRALGGHLRTVVDSGVTVVLVDHDMGLVLDVCDRVTVLDFGRVIASDTPTALRHDDTVIAAYLGREVDARP